MLKAFRNLSQNGEISPNLVTLVARLSYFFHRTHPLRLPVDGGALPCQDSSLLFIYSFDFFVRLISSSLSLSSFVPSEKVKLLIYTFFFTVETRTPISVFFGFHNLNQEEARTTTRWYKFIRSYIEAHAI